MRMKYSILLIQIIKIQMEMVIVTLLKYKAHGIHSQKNYLHDRRFFPQRQILPIMKVFLLLLRHGNEYHFLKIPQYGEGRDLRLFLEIFGSISSEQLIEVIFGCFFFLYDS